MTFYRNRVFPLLAGLLWAVFLTLDLTGLADSTWVKYAAVCLCCATALTGMRTADGKLVAAALCLTVAADWFLLVQKGASEADQIRGVGLFILVQFLYVRRLSLWWGGTRPKWARILRRLSLLTLLPVLIFLLFLLCLRLFFLSNLWPTIASFFVPLLRHEALINFSPPLFYFLNLCLNTAEAFSLGPKARRFAWGLLLFVLCDLCVGACSLGLLTSFAWWGSWLFYLPSQVLIVLSQEPEKGDPDEKRF